MHVIGVRHRGVERPPARNTKLGLVRPEAGRVIREARMRCGMRQADLAAMCGVTREALLIVEQGRGVSLRVVLTCGGVLGIALDQLVDPSRDVFAAHA